MSINIKMNPPVNITIDDDKKYTDVASLVDREDFLAAIDKLKKPWGIKGIFPYGMFKPWSLFPQTSLEQLAEFNKKATPLWKKLQNTNFTFDLSLREKIKLLDDYRKASRLDPEIAFEQDVQNIRKKYKKSPNFDVIIAHALLYGEVRNEDYKTSEMEIDSGEIEYVDFDKEARPVIVVYPNVTMTDIENTFREYSEGIFKRYQEKVLNGKIITYHTKGKIRRDRKWYWEWKEERKMGRGIYNRIANRWDTDNPNERIDDINIIEQAVSLYRRFLKR